MVRHGTLLGKCAIDGQPIHKGSGFRDEHATIVNGKWLSGDVILNLYTNVIEAFMSQSEKNEQKKSTLVAQLKKYGWRTDPETGKLTKALNRDTTIGDK